MHTFKVDLRGVVDLLSTAIYSTRSVYLRELIQNAVDATTARSGIDPGYRSTGIVITPAGVDGPSLTVRDDGIGLTAAEITDFLASVGSSLKRDSFGLPVSDMLGRFGIGLLSALMVADSIVVRTRSARGGPALQWTGRADGTYDLIELDDDLPIGTEVGLLPRADETELTKPGTVTRLAKQYARYLPIPITIAHPRGLDTITEPPAFLGGDPDALFAFGREVLDGAEPFDVIPIEVPLTATRGVAYVLPEPVPPSTGGLHRVYCRRMLVSERCPDVAPDWAFFIKLVIDSGALSPTASREALVDDDVLAATREGIARSIRAWLSQLARTDPGRLAEFVMVHYLGLKALAVHDDELAPVIVRLLPLETSRGLRSIGELVEHSSTLRFVRTTDQFRQVNALSSGATVVVNATYTWDLEVLRRLPDLIPGIEVAEVSVQDIVDRLDSVPAQDRARAAELESRAARALTGAQLAVSVRSAARADTAAFVLTDPDLIRSQERHRARDTSGSRWSRVLDVLDAASESVEADPGTQLLLNWSNPLIRRLAELQDQAVLSRAVSLLHLQAVAASGRPLTPAESRRLSDDLTDLMVLAIDPEATWTT